MHTIKIIFFTALISLGNILCAQSKEVSVPDSLSRHYYNIVFPKVSPNERYIAFNKSYDKSSDTVVLIDRKNSGHILFEKGGVMAYSVKFTQKGDLFMRAKKNVQLLKLPELKVHVWNEVSEGFYHNTLKQIVFLQNGTLKILDGDRNEVKTFANVINIKEDQNLLYYTVKDDKGYQLIEWDGNKSTVLHSSENNIIEVPYRDSNGIFVLEQNEKTGKSELVYRMRDTIIPFNKWYNGAVKSLKISQLDDKRYYLHLYGDSPPKDKSAVELWYGNDLKIKSKFYGDYIGKFFLWDPIGNEFSEIINSKLTHHVNIGNGRYMLSFDPYYKHDYTKKFKTFNLYRYDTLLKKYDFLLNGGTIVFTDEKAKYLLTYQKEEGWDLYNIATFEHRKIPVPEYENAYFSLDGQIVLFEGIGKLYQYDIASRMLHTVTLSAGFRNKIKNGRISNVAEEFSIYKQTYNEKKPLIIDSYDRENIRNAWFSFDGKSVKPIIEPTNDDITEVSWDVSQKTFTYVKSNINMPPQLVIKKGKKEELVFSSNQNDREANGIKSEVISYTNSRGVALKGVLLYPIGFDTSKKYPMVVTVYQKLRYNMNKYLIDGIGMMSPTEGINIRTLLRKGYMVYMPDIVFDDRGTGRAALDCVNTAMDAIQDNLAIDFTKVALVGHSHGGYETNFIATQSNRFATYVSGAGNSDLVRSYHSFNYDFKRPFFWQYEDGQYEMPGSFVENKALYIDNSPIYHAEKVNSPMLLWTGMQDYNIFWEQTMEFYMGLRRSKKPVIALFYPDDGHSFFKTKNRIDLYSRIYEWLDFHLENRKSAWIEKMHS